MITMRLMRFYRILSTLGAIFFSFLCLFLYTKFAGPLPLYINSVQTSKTDLFQVDGTGKVTAVPDVALVDIAVTKTSTTVSDAQNQTNTTIQHITDALKGEGIDTNSIKTTGYSITPQYDQFGKMVDSYVVTQNLEITAKPLEKVNTIIDTATSNGANIVGSTQFSFSDDMQKKLEDQARQQAVIDAKSKAVSLAHAAGIQLGNIVNVQETTSNPSPILFGAASPKTINTATPTTITPGENTVSITITLSYIIY